MTRSRTTRRVFLRRTLQTGAGLAVGQNRGMAEAASQTKPSSRRRLSPNDKLNVACIGVGGRGGSNVTDVMSENIVALCDTDQHYSKKTFAKLPKAKTFHDFRVMFDKMHRQIDAVVVSTTDHMHAPAAMMAMRYGKHVYCEKPLTHDVYEARVLTKAALEHKVATQMGNQGTASSALRQGVEAIRAGVIGPVREVHVWTDRPQWPQGMARPKGSNRPPAHLKWDLWLGTAPERPYVRNKYHPFFWRGWWDFGTGALGDMGCHIANMAFMALNLTSPTSVSSENSGFDRQSFPTWSIIKYEFPARGDDPPVTWTWYDGGIHKPVKVLRKLTSLIHGEKLSGNGSILIGEKGTMYAPYNLGGRWLLLPKEKFEDFKPPAPTLPRSPGHHQEWIAACKGGPPAMSNFAYSGPLTETILLGNLATYAGKKILWDAPNCRITNCPEADAHVRREYRKGWTL